MMDYIKLFKSQLVSLIIHICLRSYTIDRVMLCKCEALVSNESLDEM